MTEFYTIIARDGDVLTADTQASSNAHNSVRSYKTQKAAESAITRGARVPGLKYSVLHTHIADDGTVTTRWAGGEV
ncbi:hypothetical protein SEA_ESTES_143 [Mycobacterium phage Estes]|uniref:Uncharacterized protein n=1 Tax=Mycobacterium phage Estes TaxID=2759459 RepID=A0A7G9A2J2_9CAUD|nr:hypothetical protein J4U03_gp132 [Mycobacterium phage Estes]QNL30831.1 hypothetical protein SEA_ESTES_143 [Mycobacterium phage Estes]